MFEKLAKTLSFVAPSSNTPKSIVKWRIVNSTGVIAECGSDEELMSTLKAGYNKYDSDTVIRSVANPNLEITLFGVNRRQLYSLDCPALEDSIKHECNATGEFFKLGHAASRERILARAIKESICNRVLSRCDNVNVTLFNHLDELHEEILGIGYNPNELIAILYVYGLTDKGFYELTEPVVAMTQAFKSRRDMDSVDFNMHWSVQFKNKYVEVFLRNSNFNLNEHVVLHVDDRR